jgi:glycerophosphoryl diester phosphodiesterase
VRAGHRRPGRTAFVASAIAAIAGLAGCSGLPAAQTADRHQAAATARCPVLVAHQGYTGSAAGRGPVPPDSVGALIEAARAGARIVEFDVRWSRPSPRYPYGDPVVIHNRTVSATTDRTGAVAGYASGQLTAMHLVGPGRRITRYRIPTMLQMLRAAIAWHVRVIIEIKVGGLDAGQARVFAAQVREAGAMRITTVHSFYPDSLATLRRVSPEFDGRTTLLSLTPVTRAPGEVGIDLPGGVVTAAVVRRIHANGLIAGAYTSSGSGVPDDAASWRRLARDGVNRIITGNAAGYLAWCRS